MKRLLFALLFMSVTTPALPQVAGQNFKVTPVNCSGTVVTGGTAVTPIAAGVAVHGWMLTNLDTAEALWWSVSGTAVAAASGSFPLAAAAATTFVDANGTFITPGNFGTSTALSVVAATTAHKFSCIWW